jgi:hypothetical protein
MVFLFSLVSKEVERLNSQGYSKAGAPHGLMLADWLSQHFSK